MKPDRVVRTLGYAARKLWLGSNFEKDLASASYALVAGHTTVTWLAPSGGQPLGALSGYRVRSQVVSVRDSLDSFFLEQKFIAGDNQHVLVSYSEFKVGVTQKGVETEFRVYAVSKLHFEFQVRARYTHAARSRLLSF
jgi:hypothetical protein